MILAPEITSRPARPRSRLVRVIPGVRLLSREQPLGTTPRPGLDELVRLATECGLRGRGGAGFPFATKLATAARSRGRPVVVVNAAEGEPASAKDSVLMLTRTDLVLDGAVAAAAALRASTVHVVVPEDRSQVVDAVRRALEARAHRRRGERDPVRVRLHVAEPRFVAGQEQAVLQLLAGKPGLPVTAWAPAVVDGLGGRPTLLSNAETWAQVAAMLRLGAAGYASLGAGDEPGTLLLTVAGDTADAAVLEVPSGTRLDEVLAATGHDPAGPVLTGGYHGSWLPAGAAFGLRLARADMVAAGGALGAGVLLPLRRGACPVTRTASIAAYLAGQTAGRCGPCRNGLPALASHLAALAGTAGADASGVRHLLGRVARRGACAHPDGTARLVGSLLTAFPEEVAVHERGDCAVEAGDGWPR